MGKYQVIVGNVGTVYDGDSVMAADVDFDMYKTISQLGHGRAGGEEVTLMVDGEPTRQFVPKPEPDPAKHHPAHAFDNPDYRHCFRTMVEVSMVGGADNATPEIDKMLDDMDFAWRRISDESRKNLNRLGAFLNMLDTPEWEDKRIAFDKIFWPEGVA